MAEPVVRLEPTRLAVEPGGQARATVTIDNPGSIVEGYRVEVLDELTGRGAAEGPATWSQVLVPSAGSPDGGSASAADGVVTVYPGRSETVVIVFAPPAGSRVPGGACAFAVRVVSVVDAADSVVVEGDLDVGRVMALQGKLAPVTSSGRWHGNHVLRVTNGGNSPTRLALRAEDPDQALGYLLRPETVELPVGGEAAVRLKVRTRHPRLRGTVAQLPFTVVGEATGPDAGPAPPQPMPQHPGVDPNRVVVDGAFRQKPILTATAMVAAGLLVAGIAGVTALGLRQREPVLTYEERGAPATPEMQAAATGSDTIRLSWAPVGQVERYDLLHLDDERAPERTEQLDPQLAAYPVVELEPDTEYCFQLVAVRGEARSPTSDPICARTAAAPAGSGTAEPTQPPTTGPAGEPTEPASSPEETTAPGDGTTGEPTSEPTDATTGPPEVPEFGPGEWIAVLGTYVEEAPPGEAGARELHENLLANGFAAQLLRTADVPVFDGRYVKSAWLVYLDGFETSDEATAVCEDVLAAGLVFHCDPPVQPVPPG